MTSKRKLRRRIAELEAQLIAERPPEWSPFVTGPIITGGTTTIRCTCPPNRGDNYHGSCPIHDVQVTYTAGWPVRA